MDSPESPLEPADGITKYGHGKNSGFWLVHGSNGPYSNMALAHKFTAKFYVCLCLLAKRFIQCRLQAVASALTLKKPTQVRRSERTLCS